MRLCVIGNSHVAALREAAGPSTTLGAHALDFYAVPGGRQPIVEIIDGRLRPLAPPQGVLTTVDGAQSGGLVLSDYDALVVSACGLIAARLKHVAANPQIHPCSSLACAEWVRDDGIERPTAPLLVSTAAFEIAVDAYVRSHASVRLLFQLADCFAGSVLIQPWPAPNRSLLSDDDWFVNAWYGPLGPSVWGAFFAAQRRALARIASELGPRFVFLDYPAHDAPSPGGFMDGAFCAADPWHANARYGALVLDQIVTRLKAPPQPEPRREEVSPARTDLTGTLLLTTTTACWVLEMASGRAAQFHSGLGVYYGLTFDHDTCYVAARNAPYGTERATQDNLILCFDRDLRLRRTLRAPRPIRDVHQIVFHHPTLFIVSTYDDCIVLYDVAAERWDWWHPFQDGGTDCNRHHINSIHVDDKQILLAGNKPDGWYALFDRNRAPLRPGRAALGHGTHNVWPEPDGSIAACSSVEGRIVSDRGPRNVVHPEGWLRGIARISGRTILGVCQNRVRDMRGPSDCSLVQVDDADRIERCWSFHSFGMVHDVRALGVGDSTHNGIAFTLRPGALDRCDVVYPTSKDLVDLRPQAPTPKPPQGEPEPTMDANGFRRVYFYHLKKCGGTSLDHWLGRQVADDRLNDPHWLRPLVSAFLDDPAPTAEAVQREQTVGRSVFYWTDAVTSHMPLRRWAPPDTLCVTMLRDPVDRLVSQIADWRRLGPGDYAEAPHHVATMIRDASTLSLRSFLETHGHGTLLLDNYLVRALAAVRLGFSVKAVAKAGNLLSDALDALTDDFHVVGLTDRLGVSLNAIAERLGRAPEDQPPTLNQTTSKSRLAGEVEEARDILAEMTADDRRLYEEAERLFVERHAAAGAAYDRDAFEQVHATRAVQQLSGRRHGKTTVYSIRAPIVGSGFHGRDAAGSDHCRVWSGPAAQSVLYVPVPAGARLALQLWVHGYADERQRDTLAVTLDGTRVAHRFVEQAGYREIIEIVGTPSRPFAALGIDVGATAQAGEAGRPGHDARFRGLSFDRYGWTILP